MGPHAGYVAIIGKPNAGKSTLLNAVLGQKLSIVTPKAQTTRHRIIGVHSGERFQCILLDTPGILRPVSQPVSLPISVCATCMHRSMGHPCIECAKHATSNVLCGTGQQS